MRTWLLFLFALAIIGLSSGCGSGSSGPKTYSVTGTVTLDGSPLETGSVVFDPVDGAGQGCAGEIKAGKFNLKACVGSMKVSITSSKDTGKKDQYGEAIYENVLPREVYDVRSKLTANVTADGPNAFTFELQRDAK